MQFRVTSATISKSVNAERRTTSVHFGLEAVDVDQIDLATGEVFKHRRLAAESDRLVKASIGISRASGGKAPIDEGDPTRIGHMSYYEASGRDFEYEPSSIFLSLYMPDEEFDQLFSAVLQGKPPDTMNFEIDGLDYYGPDDGSWRKWDNKAHEHLPIRHATWNIEALKAPEEDSEPPPETVLEREVKNLANAVRNIRTQLAFLIALSAAVVVILWEGRPH
jgi:hypothetical protein